MGRTKDTFISGGAIFAAGTTGYKAARGSSATVHPTGRIRADRDIVAGGTIDASSAGFTMVAGNVKAFTAGTYFGTGAATAAIIASGLTTVHHVFLHPAVPGAASTTVLRNKGKWDWCTAEATAGSFYARCLRRGSGATFDEVLSGAHTASTVKWMAMGAV